MRSKIIFYTFERISTLQRLRGAASTRLEAHQPASRRANPHETPESSRTQRQTPRFQQNQRPANAPFPLAYKQKNTGQGASPQRPRHAPARRAHCLLNFHLRIMKRAKLPHRSPVRIARTIPSPAAQKNAEQETNSGLSPHPSSRPARKLRCTQTHAGQSPVHGIPAMSRSIRRALSRLWPHHCSSMRRISSFFCSAAMKSSIFICPPQY